MVVARVDRGGKLGPIKKPEPKKKLNPETIDKIAFEIKDKNNDGGLSKDEFVGEAKGLKKLASRLKFERYDKDNDGSVSKEEYLAGRKGDRDMRKSIEDAIKEYPVGTLPRNVE